MADQAQNQENGGGEGKPAEQVQQQFPAQVEEMKSVEPLVEQPKTTQEQQGEIKTEIAEAKPAPPVQGNEPAEPKVEVTEVKPEAPPVEENKSAELKQDEPMSSAVETKENLPVTQNGDWQQREQELLKKIEELEKVTNERTEDGLKLELKVREEEIDLLKARVKNLETELQAVLSKPSGKNHEMIENIKQQHEELLSKARGMIFDKTKMVKNQELQIEALTTQVQSLKDINLITKDLLEIRNSEVKAMEERLQAMEARFKAEKDRYGLVLQRAQTSSNINDDLRKEYETQLAIFKELREKYELRVQALVAENTRLKESVQGPGTSG
ncbi:hypothetical protein K1T71_006874 [Dendrolimus kikuchii]|uniref:Uncharacterized protein n=1 Tax=Dendrolimus kikuchii TaxID=765133 RepID=A0ACC1D2D1_9NEOP|nr:hypothetical protein K1T71_006874 [Dendrolimus kikuchii]